MTKLTTSNLSSHLLMSMALTLLPVSVVFSAEAFNKAPNNYQQENQQENELQAMQLVKQFAGQLKPQLKAAMIEGGPVHAINVCAQTAPTIARQLSEQSGWRIKRVSSQNRNPVATPDTWEASAIKRFEQKLAAGASPASLQYAEMTATGFRFAKAQLTEPLCLVCHGQKISPDVTEALVRLYPDDLATGYEAGQIRGIFSLIKPQ